MSDLASVMRWGRDWLVRHSNVYQSPDSVTDYPPHAIVLLSSLGLLPTTAAAFLWASANLSMALAAPYLAARFFRPHAPFRVVLLPVLMFLCWSGVRTFLQFSLFSLTLSMMALLLADRRRILSGISLGLAMIKPQVAIPVFCWVVFTRRWRIAATAALVVGIGSAIFCLWAGADPIQVASRYLSILAGYYTGFGMLTGLSDLRPAIRAISSDVSEVYAIAISIALGLFTGICVAGFQEGAARNRVLYTAPPLVACWSLLTFYHLTYGFIVLLPVLMLLALADVERSRLRVLLFWILQVGMMVDVPSLARYAGIAQTSLGMALSHVDRALILILFSGLVALAWREPPLLDDSGGAQQHIG